ncbi:DUF1353 domain-containing protein [Stenotrophomonas sp. GD03657]|uniref:DUF1353 domain-containing protein n=1 Tax=Stenotrophomonas sp. GD03657 TaxID=2975363 RepID=UPI00244CF13B|nr:DUF1353 domain-containing protein [Stenotrophomonas sp. GD03657]MDH2154241.1 DUF1353 domain-containing protein [Stenotrophomonas sp. GD03657]
MDSQVSEAQSAQEAVAAELQKALPFTHVDNENQALIYYDEAASNKLSRDYWRVARSFKFYVGERSDNRWVLIPAGYLSDGATVPRILWWLIPPWGRHGHAAIVHDYLCDYARLYDNGEEKFVPRKQADKIFNEAMKVTKVNPIIRHLMYGAVRLWARFGNKLGRTDLPQFRARKIALEEAWRASPPELDYTSFQPV